MIAPYSVEAFNTARASENKMHDDTVARQFGFAGGLVTGVDLCAYMLHTPVAHFGRDFLNRGLLDARFVKPVYDGDRCTLEADALPDGGLALRLLSRGEVCAVGKASLTADLPAVDLGAWRSTAPVSVRRPVDEASYPVGRRLGTVPHTWAAADAAGYAADVREQEPMYAAEGFVHPGTIQRMMNRVLVENAMLGPWIHVGSRMQLLAPIKIDAELTSRAVVTDAYEKKGHRFVAFDAVAVADGAKAVALCRHTAIVQPRRQEVAA